MNDRPNMGVAIARIWRDTVNTYFATHKLERHKPMARMEATEITMIGGPCDGETRTMTDTAMIAVGHKVENDSSDRGYDVHRYVVTESGGSRVLTYAGIEPPILVDNDV